MKKLILIIVISLAYSCVEKKNYNTQKKELVNKYVKGQVVCVASKAFVVRWDRSHEGDTYVLDAVDCRGEDCSIRVREKDIKICL